MAHDHHDHDHDSPEAIKKAARLIYIIGGVLVVGTFLTVAVRGLDMGSRAGNIALGMLIAIIKALCVMLVFMHLKSERGLIYKFLFFTIVFVTGLFVLTYLGWSDPLVSHIIPTH